MKDNGRSRGELGESLYPTGPEGMWEKNVEQNGRKICSVGGRRRAEGIWFLVVGRVGSWLITGLGLERPGHLTHVPLRPSAPETHLRAEQRVGHK